jgi:hypothetical protein
MISPEGTPAAPSESSPMALRHARLQLLDRYLRIPTLSRHVTAEMVQAVRAFWRDIGIDLEPLLPVDGCGSRISGPRST